MARRRRYPELDVKKMQPMDPPGEHDLRADVHGHAIDYACDLDRRYFAEHPAEGDYVRDPVPHEWCRVVFADRCLTVLEEPTFVVVRFLHDGVRAREPWFARRVS